MLGDWHSVARIPGESGEDRAGRCPRTQHLKLSPRTHLCIFSAADSEARVWTWGMSTETHRFTCLQTQKCPNRHMGKHTDSHMLKYVQTLTGTHKHMGCIHANPHQSASEAHGYT